VAREDEFVLTDPSIHSSDDKFGTTDLGQSGMLSFFKTHICSQVHKKFIYLQTNFELRFVQISRSTTRRYLSLIVFICQKANIHSKTMCDYVSLNNNLRISIIAFIFLLMRFE
jgi:hypothetical protein